MNQPTKHFVRTILTLVSICFHKTYSVNIFFSVLCRGLVQFKSSCLNSIRRNIIETISKLCVFEKLEKSDDSFIVTPMNNGFLIASKTKNLLNIICEDFEDSSQMQLKQKTNNFIQIPAGCTGKMETEESIEYLMNQHQNTYQVKKSEIIGQHLMDVIDLKSANRDGNYLDLHPLEIDTGMNQNCIFVFIFIKYSYNFREHAEDCEQDFLHRQFESPHLAISNSWFDHQYSYIHRSDNSSDHCYLLL